MDSMFTLMIKDAAWQQRASNLPYKTPDEALIAESLVEKESARPEERPLIAGALVKRLNKICRYKLIRLLFMV